MADDYESGSSRYDRHDNNRYDEQHHLRRDVHEASTASQLARLLSTLALITGAIALALSLWALNKAGDAQNAANQANDRAQQALQAK
jgi:hypothetical protein